MLKYSLSAVLLFLSFSFASTIGDVDVVCKIDSVEYTGTVAMSGSSFGQRLDLKPIGAIISPWPVPVCPQCGFPRITDSLKREKLEKYQNYVFSPEFKDVVNNKESSYYRIALFNILDSLDNATIGYRFLQASWQVENDRDKYESYLSKSLQYYVKAMDNDSLTREEEVSIRFTIGEILRLLGRFDEAEKHFSTMQDEIKEFPFRPLIEYELSLIVKKDRKAKPIPELKKSEEDIKKEPGYKMMVESDELNRFLPHFTVEGIQFKQGYTHGSSIEDMEEWSGDFTLKSKLRYNCMAELIFGIDSLDSIHVGLTPEKLVEVFKEITSSNLLKKMIPKESRIRIRAEADRLHWKKDVVSVLYDHLIKIYPNLPSQKEWVYMIIDSDSNGRTMESIYHPYGSDLYILGSSVDFKSFRELIDTEFPQSNLNGKKEDYFSVLNNKREVSFIKKEKEIIESVEYFWF